MDKEALKKRIFAEGEKAKGGVNRFLEEEKQELSHQLDGRSERSQNPVREPEQLQNSEQLQNLSLLQNAERKAEQPQSILQKSEKSGLSFKKPRHLSKKPLPMQRREAEGDFRKESLSL